MACRVSLSALLLVLLATGCRWSDRRLQRESEQYVENAARAVRQQHDPELWQPPSGTASLPPDGAEQTAMPTLGPLPDQPIALYGAIETALANSRIARVTSGGSVTTAATTLYDVEAFQARLRAALAAFDTRFQSEVYSNQFRSPPSAFFGPGLAQPSKRNEAALTAGLLKPLTTGGTLSAAYNPSPGFLFVPGSSSSIFNPRYVSEFELSLRQPLMRNGGRQVTIAPVEVSRLEVEQSAWDFKASVMASVRSVVEAYWDLHAARVAVAEYKTVIPVLEEIVRVQQASLRANLVIASDVARSHAQLYDYRQEYIRLQSALVSRELRLRNLLNLPPTHEGKLVPQTMPTSIRIRLDPSQGYLQALENRPDIVRRRLDVSIRQLEVLVRANQRKPDLDFTALYRLNGLGESLGDALDQMSTAEFADLQVGLSLSMPIGLRQATAAVHEARLRLARDNNLLNQEMLSVSHELYQAAQSIEFAYAEYEQASLQLEAADEWVRGARLRYLNPTPDSGSGNWMLQNLNDYYRAIESRTDAAIEVAATLSKYNIEIVRYEEVKGTLLDFFAINYDGDPCRQLPEKLRSQQPHARIEQEHAERAAVGADPGEPGHTSP